MTPETRVDPQLMQFARDVRANYRAAIPAAGTPDPVAAVRTIDVPADAPARSIPLRIYTPMGGEGATKLPIILFVHGGGFVSGDFDTHDVLARAIANRAAALVAAIDYRLAPEHPFPAGLNDVVAALTWLAGHAAEIGGDPGALIVSGDSAGGNLVASAALIARDRGGPSIRAQWLLYPPVSNKMDTPSWELFGNENFPTRAMMAGIFAAYLPAMQDVSAPAVAPLWARHDGLPPALIQVGELDPLRDEGVAYAAALQRAGVEAEARIYAGQQHGFVQFFKDRENNSKGEVALTDGIAFLRTILSRAV